MKQTNYTQRNTLIILACLLTLIVMFTVDGYLEYKEEQRNNQFLCNRQLVESGSLTDYFLKGINPSY